MSRRVTVAMVEAAAEVRLRQYSSEYDATHLSWKDFADEVREILEAALSTEECGATADAAAYAGRPGKLVCVKMLGHRSSHTSAEGASWVTQPALRSTS